MIVRPERSGEATVIRDLTEAAFVGAEHSSGTEGAIVDAFRLNDALTVSLVAEEDGVILGHVAFSPVTINGEAGDWYGLGPVSVRPGRQGEGIGAALVNAGLVALKARDAGGCVVLGDPAYYGRFGFSADHALRYPGVPEVYFQSLVLSGPPPVGTVAYDPAFEAS